MKQFGIEKLFILMLSIESLPFLSSLAQTTPLIYFFCLLFAPIYFEKIYITPLFKILIFFILFAVAITAIYFVKENINGDSKVISLRVINFSRQFVALILGLCLFICIRNILLTCGSEFVLRYCIYSIIPIFIFVVLVDIPLYLISPNVYRIKSYFSEPSHLSEFVVQIIFACMYVYNGLQNKIISNKWMVIYFVLGLVLLALTSSGTGFIRFFLLIAGVIIFEDNKKLKAAFFLLMVIIGAILFWYFSKNSETYLSTIVVSLPESKDETGSFVDRFYSFFGPVSKIFESNTALGYGLGGDTIYYNDFYPSEFIEIVKLVKDGGFNIVSFWGKILVYTGIAGVIIWLVIIVLSFKIIKRVKPYYKIGAVLFGIFFHGLIGSGAFLLVHTWFWLAFVDYVYINKCEIQHANISSFKK